MFVKVLTLLGVSALVAAAPAAAVVPVQPVTFTSAGIYNPGTVDVTSGGATKSEYAAQLVFSGQSLAKASFDALGFCIDLPHLIYVGIGSQLKETLQYHVAALTQDGFGNPLSNGQVREITGLAHLGFSIGKGSAADKPAQLAAIQQAIWTIEYPTSTFAATGPYAAAQASYAATFLAEAPKLPGTFARTLISDDSNNPTQAQITDVGGVPEPTVWAELLAGFGVVGILSRRRQPMVRVAA